MHYINDFWLGLTSYGTLGTGRIYDLMADKERDGSPAPRPRDILHRLDISWTPSLEFPPHTENDYLDQIVLGVGSVRGIDTLMSWTGGYNLVSYTGFRETSSLRSMGPIYDAEAHAEQQFYLNLTDTSWFTNRYSFEQYNNRRYITVGVEVHQTSYAWSMRFAKRFILVDYWIVNVTELPIDHAVIGLRITPFVLNDKLYTPRDHPVATISGTKVVTDGPAPGLVDSMNMVWFADNDGDPLSLGGWAAQSPSSAVGIRVLRMPEGGRFTYNWFAPIGTGETSWGPHHHSGRSSAQSGRPLSNREWYRLMINDEIDYDQMYAAVDRFAEGWARPVRSPGDAVHIASGTTPELVISTGQVGPIMPGDSVPFTIGIVVGGAFHRIPRDYAYYFDPYDPSAYEARLDFTDLIENARWAGWMYDIPGYDSDGDGYRGENWPINCTAFGCDSIYYKGDGVADFHGPTPPTPPPFDIETRPHTVIMRWSGALPELEIDPMSGVRDFEGYRIYAGRFNADDQLSLLASWDKVDYKRAEYVPQLDNWRYASHPHSISEWKLILDDPDFDPRDYAEPKLESAYRDSVADTVTNTVGQMWEFWVPRYSCWEPQAHNRPNEFLENGQPAANIIQRVATRDTILGPDTLSYGIYEAQLTNLSTTVPLYFALSTFDFGNNPIDLEPLESYPSNNSHYAEAIYSAEVVVDSGLGVSVYPNPYKLAYRNADGGWTSYYEEGYEGRGILQFEEQDRRVHFTNLPDTATIRIYSLDGDLVRVINHPDPFLTTYSSSVGWDLVTRNAQAVVSGIYIWRVDSRLGSQVGKLVIIK